VEGTPRVNDDESLEIRYFPLEGLPELHPDHRLRIEHAVAGGSAYFKPPMKWNDMIRAAVQADVPAILALIRELAAYERLEHLCVATEGLLGNICLGRSGRRRRLCMKKGGK